MTTDLGEKAQQLGYTISKIQVVPISSLPENLCSYDGKCENEEDYPCTRAALRVVIHEDNFDAHWHSCSEHLPRLTSDGELRKLIGGAMKKHIFAYHSSVSGDY